MPEPIVTALSAFAVLLLGAAGAYLSSRITNRTQREQREVEVETKAQEIKAEIETQAVVDRKEVRLMFLERIDELKRELQEVRTTMSQQIDELRQEIRDGKDVAKSQSVVITDLQKENGKLRVDVDHMPEEIARLEKLLEKKGEGGGQGSSKSVLSSDSEQLVDDERDKK